MQQKVLGFLNNVRQAFVRAIGPIFASVAGALIVEWRKDDMHVDIEIVLLFVVLAVALTLQSLLSRREILRDLKNLREAISREIARDGQRDLTDIWHDRVNEIEKKYGG